MANPNEHTLTSTAVTLEETTRRALHVLFVERLDAGSKTKDGRAAMTRLAKSKPGEKECKHPLADLVATTNHADAAKRSFRDSQEYLDLLFELRDWYLEWSGIAKLTVVGHRQADDQAPRLPDPPRPRDEARQRRPRHREPDRRARPD